MKAISAKVSRGLVLGSRLFATDNSGALIVEVIAVKRGKTAKRRQQYAKVADWIRVAVKKGLPEMKGKVFDAVIVRQKKEFMRRTGERVAFVDNAAVLLKDEKGNPKGTQIKGPVAREILERWPQVAKISRFVL
jgi:large subunit ribosomal protein L14